MEREGHSNVKFFFGKEVEHTPAYNMDTLFVVGVQTVEEIEQALAQSTYQTKHIYFGANQSFPTTTLSAAEWRSWAEMIRHFLALDYLCTLDVDVAQVSDLAETFLVERNNFIPMISVKIPYIKLLNYNATVKIDDTDFKHSNPGVWCHSVHDLMDRSKFTDWSCYTKDEVLQ